MRTSKELVEDANKLILEYETIKDPNKTTRFCLGKAYNMYWLITEFKQFLESK